MPLFLTYHPWTSGTMDREQVESVIGGAYDAWQQKGITYRLYVGTADGSEGYSLISAPSRAALIQAFEESRIPYLTVSEAWQISEEDLHLAAAAGRTQPRVL